MSTNHSAELKIREKSSTIKERKHKPITIVVTNNKTYPTERTRPVSLRSASPETPRMRSSRIEETSVGAALAEARPLTKAG